MFTRCSLIWAAGSGAVFGAVLSAARSASSFQFDLGCAVLCAVLGLFLHAASHTPLNGTRREWLLLSLPALGLSVCQLFRPLTGLSASLFFIVLTLLILFVHLRHRSLDGITLGMHLLLCWFACYCVLSNLCISPDSYSYYEMAKTIFTDFGRVSAIRQYVAFTDYGISFPYFYPLLLAVVDLLTGLGMYSGILLNCVISAAAALLFLPLSRQICSARWPGLVAAIALLTNRKYLSEVLSGRAIPVAVLCVVVVLLLLTRADRWSLRSLLLTGLMTGISMATRFDNLTVVGFVGLCVLLFSGRERFWKAVCYGVGALLPLLPWVWYSLSHFGIPWISDNGGTLTMVTITTPQRFFIPGEVPATLFTTPQEWFSSLLSRSKTVLLLLLLMFVATQFLLPGALLLLNSLKNRLTSHRDPASPRFNRWVPFLILIFYSLKTLAYCLVGYETARYHAETVVLVIFAFCCLLAPSTGKRAAAFCTALYLVSALWSGIVYATPLRLTVPSICTHPSYASCINFGFQTQDADWPALEHRILTQPLLGEQVLSGPEWVGRIQEQIADSDARIFFLSAAGDPAAYSAYTGQKTFACISNMNAERLLYLTKHYIRPTHIVVTGEYDLHWLDALSPAFTLTELGQVDNNFIFTCSDNALKE